MIKRIILNLENINSIFLLDESLLEPIVLKGTRWVLRRERGSNPSDLSDYGYKNYQIGVNKYKIVPIIFPKESYREEKLKGQMSYPIEVFSRNKKAKELKKDIDSIASILFNKLQNWKDLKPVRGIIEDFFKVAKDAFGLGEFHCYTVESMSRKIYLCLLLTALIVQQGYKTKTQLQRLAEGNIVQDTPVSKKSNKTKSNNKKDKKSETPLKIGQQELEIGPKEKQTTLQKFCFV